VGLATKPSRQRHMEMTQQKEVSGLRTVGRYRRHSSRAIQQAGAPSTPTTCDLRSLVSSSQRSSWRVVSMRGNSDRWAQMMHIRAVSSTLAQVIVSESLAGRQASLWDQRWSRKGQRTSRRLKSILPESMVAVSSEQAQPKVCRFPP